MQIIRITILAGLVAFATGCASTGPAKVDQSSDRGAEVYRLSRTSLSFPDGVVSALVLNTYDSRARLVREDQTTGGGVINYSRQFRYKTDGSVEIVTTNEIGEIKARVQQTYEGARLTKERVLNAVSQEQSVSDYRYDSAGNRIQWTLTVPGVTRTDTEYLYEGNRNTVVIVKDSSGKPVRKFARQFDSEGRLVAEHESDGQNQPLTRHVFEYRGNSLIRESISNGQGEVQRSIQYTNNELSLPVKVEYFNSRGQLLEIKSQDWIKIRVDQ